MIRGDSINLLLGGPQSFQNGFSINQSNIAKKSDLIFFMASYSILYFLETESEETYIF